MSTESKTELSLAAIFALCDTVAMTGETIRTEDEAREFSRLWLGLNAKNQAREPSVPNATDAP